MPISLSDFAQLPQPFKYIIVVGILTGLAVKVNAFGVEFSFGDVFSYPLIAALGAVGVITNYTQLYVLTVVVLLCYFVLAMTGGAKR